MDWLTLRSTALPYNLLVLQRLTAATAMTFRNNFETAWLPQYDELLNSGRLCGIDMTIFSGLDPYPETNGTLRFTPRTMTLLEVDDRKNPNPIAVYVADPKDIDEAQTYVPPSASWIYGMQMATPNALPAGNIIYQLLAPQPQYTIAFDLLLLLFRGSSSPAALGSTPSNSRATPQLAKPAGARLTSRSLYRFSAYNRVISETGTPFGSRAITLISSPAPTSPSRMTPT